MSGCHVCRYREILKPFFRLFLFQFLFFFFAVFVGSSRLLASQGGTLIWGRGNDATSLDPANQWDGFSSQVVANIYDNLVMYEPGSTEVRAGLAESWTISDDHLTWTFNLRRNVRFHDGTPLDADAVIFNFERQMNPDNPYRFGTCECWNAMFQMVRKVEKTGEYSFRITLDKPYAPFEQLLGMTPVAIASPAAIKKYGKEFCRNPVGSGPFRFVEWVPGDRIVIERAPEHWSGRAKLDRIVFKTIPDNRARLTELLSGAIHVAESLNPDDLQQLQRSGEFEIMTAPGLNIGYVAMNTKKKPFDDVRVRRAVNHAINKVPMIKFFYQGLGIPAVSPLPPTMWGHEDSLVPYEYDPEKARKLLAQAGLENGFDCTFFVMPAGTTIPQPGKIGESIRNNLKKVGIRAKIFTCEWKEYQERVARGEHDMGMLSWSADFGDPDNFLYVLFDKDNAKPGVAENIAFYENDTLHVILLEAQTTFDHQRRIELYKQAQRIIHEDAPWLPLAYATQVIVCRKNVRGIKMSPVTYERYMDVYIESR